jgi:uncharacterized OsmC-like protein
MEDAAFGATLVLRQGYEFDVTTDQPLAPLRVDEAPPLGGGAGPSPTRMLATAVGHCLGASLMFCLRKARIDVDGLEVRVEGRMARTAAGRLRVGGLSVRLAPGIPAAQRQRAARCLEIFQDYCVVTESVRAGLEVDVVVEPAEPAPSPA